MAPNILKENGALRTSGANYLTLHHIPEDLNSQQMCCKSHKSHDKKSIAGKGRLSVKEISNLQNYYDIQIRRKRERQQAEYMKRKIKHANDPEDFEKSRDVIRSVLQYVNITLHILELNILTQNVTLC